jgi:hypothetical protein
MEDIPMPGYVEPGYRTAAKPGVARSHTGDLFDRITPGDRVQVTSVASIRFGTVQAANLDYYLIAMDEGADELHHKCRVTFDPDPIELDRRMDVIRSGWSDDELAKRAPHLHAEFRWPVAQDLTTGNF